MLEKIPEEYLDDKGSFKCYNFRKSVPLNIEITSKSNTKNQPVRMTITKNLPCATPIHIVKDDSTLNNKLNSSQEIPKYANADNHKKFFKNMICNADFGAAEGDKKSSEKVNKPKSECLKKYQTVTQIKDNAIKTNSVYEKSKSRLANNIKRNNNTGNKPLKKLKILVENHSAQKKSRIGKNNRIVNKVDQELKKGKTGTSLITLLKPKEERKEKLKAMHKEEGKTLTSHVEHKIYGFIAEKLKALEEIQKSNASSTHNTPKTSNNRKSSFTTSNGKKETSSKIYMENKKSQQIIRSSIATRVKLLNDIIENTSKFSEQTKSRILSKTTVKMEETEKYEKEYVPSSCPPLLKIKNLLKNPKEDIKVGSKEFLPYISPPVIKSKSCKLNSTKITLGSTQRRSEDVIYKNKKFNK